MNRIVEILAIFLMIHVPANSMVTQPKLSTKSEAKLSQYKQALITFNNALIAYNKLDPDKQKKYTFDFYTFTFIHDDVAQKYYNAKDNVFEISLELSEMDTDNFMLASDGHFCRKVFTDPSLGTYIWVFYEDYETVIKDLDTFKTSLKQEKNAPKKTIGSIDSTSKEAIESIERIHKSVEELRQMILLASFL